jgi:hypothetical protein
MFTPISTDCGTLRLAMLIVFAGCPAAMAEAVREARPVPISQNQLPYHGYGSVTIVDDGTILVEMGGKETITYWDDQESVEQTPYDAVAYRIDTTGLALVQAGNEVYFDRKGKQIQMRGLRSNRVFRTMFPDSDARDPNAPPTAIAWFTGDLTVAFNDATSVLTLSAKDTEGTGRVFTFQGRVVTGAPVDSSQVDDDLVLVVVSAGSSECSVICAQGSGNISCTNTGCKCVCKSGMPSCICTNAIE